jgi:predicted transcriptional regulator of viral defense system
MELLINLPYFTLVMVMQVRGVNDHNAKIWLGRMVGRGEVIRLTRGKYMSHKYYLSHKHESSFVGMVANIIQPQSYLSEAWVLQKYGVMTEGIFNITSVTTKHTREIVNKIGRFVYYHIDDKYFDGYVETEVGGMPVREARVGKALYDYLYLRKLPSRMGDEGYTITEDLRLNLGHLGNEVRREWEGWVEKYRSPKMKRIMNNIGRSVWES